MRQAGAIQQMIAARNVLTERGIGGATTKHAYWGLEVAVEKLILYKMVQGCGWVSDIQNGSRMWVGEWAAQRNRSRGSRVSLSSADSEARRSLRRALTPASRRSLASAVSEARRLLLCSRSVASRCSLASAVSEARRLLLCSRSVASRCSLASAVSEARRLVVRSRSVANRISLSGCAELSEVMTLRRNTTTFSQRLKRNWLKPANVWHVVYKCMLRKIGAIYGRLRKIVKS